MPLHSSFSLWLLSPSSLLQLLLHYIYTKKIQSWVTSLREQNFSYCYGCFSYRTEHHLKCHSLGTAVIASQEVKACAFISKVCLWANLKADSFQHQCSALEKGSSWQLHRYQCKWYLPTAWHLMDRGGKVYTTLALPGGVEIPEQNPQKQPWTNRRLFCQREGALRLKFSSGLMQLNCP